MYIFTYSEIPIIKYLWNLRCIFIWLSQGPVDDQCKSSIKHCFDFRACDLPFFMTDPNIFGILRSQIEIKPGPETKVQVLHIGEERDDFFYFL